MERVNFAETSMNQNNQAHKTIKITAWIFGLLLLWPILRSISTSNDLNIFFSAAERLTQLKNLYKPGYDSEGWVLNYYYSPLFATLLAPFTFLPKTTFLPDQVPLALIILKIVWATLMVWMISDMVRIIKTIFPNLKTNSNADLPSLIVNQINFAAFRKGLFWAIFGFITWRWCFLNILYGQMTILILWGCMRAFEYPTSFTIRRIWTLPLGVNIKVLPIYLYGLFFLQGKFRTLLTLIALLAATILLPYLYLPYEYHNELIGAWLENINPFSQSHIIEVGEGGFVDFGALVTKYFTSLHVPGEDRLMWFNMSKTGVFWITQSFRLLVLFLSALLVFQFKKLPSFSWKEFWLFAVFLGAIPIAFPHQRDYSLMLQLPMLMIVWYHWVAGDRLMVFPYKFCFFLAAFLMGNLFFMEAFPSTLRLNWVGYRIQGIGGLIFWITFIVYSINFIQRNKSDLE